MWAGGEIEFKGPLHQGDLVMRRSEIRNVELKTGRAGELVFVTVAHDYSVAGAEIVSEIQNIVYRDLTPVQFPHVSEELAPDTARGEVARFIPNSVLLFRYSALTFNGHRIHYDERYARDVEGYPGLVVHGPLQMTLLLNMAERVDGKLPRRVKYRGLAPLIAGPPATLHYLAEGGTRELWCRSAAGFKTMQATCES
jgi:3-methylfumaryl-CoA hydratase